MDSRLETLAAEWLAIDKNETTRAEIEQLLDSQNAAELEKLLGTHISFGTAGLRAQMQAGFSRMNDVTVSLASQGLASYLRLHSPSPTVVIGHDHRHNSARFARLTAAAMQKRGVKVYFFEDLIHTPMVPFAVQLMRAGAGVMITASHNPAKDNGYKVYWSNGCQIIPPHDVGIAAKIAEEKAVETWEETLGDNVVMLDSIPRELYFDRCEKLAVTNLEPIGEEIEFVYTPMHGVGLPPMTRIVSQAGPEFTMTVVPQQAHCDPDFSTVRFPNPEESGALDLAISLAEKKSIAHVIASDPDADRFAAAQYITPEKRWHMFSGNEIGILFASHIFTNWANTDPDERSDFTMLASTVSSRMLASMAVTEGFKFEETLTGFKWLGTRAMELGAVYAFEEALGYMFTSVVHDKDGIAAAAVWLSMLKVGVNPYERLQELYRQYGYFASADSYFTSPSPQTTKKVFARIRSLGGPYPKMLGTRRIARWRDLTTGYDSTTEDGKPVLPVSRSSEMITVDLEGDVRFTVRGSGTEPKIKMYIESKADSMEEATKRAKEVSRGLTREWFKPKETGLVSSAENQ